jgi:glutathione S-transferase
MRRYKLYIEEYCPYCNKVRQALPQLGLSEEHDVEIKNRSAGNNREELLALGGSPQVPYLVDTKTSKAMYESGDIIAYLQEQISLNK